jgi:2-iminobutanoate/2-iminopropanoate deaminase
MKKKVLIALLLLAVGPLWAQKQVIQTEKAPAAIGPYSQGVRANGLLFVAGQIGLHPDTRKLVEGGVETEIVQIMENIKAILAAARLDLSQVVNTTIYLKDMSQFAKVNEVYGRYFKEQYPARATVGVADLPAGASVEIAVVAAVPPGRPKK